MFPRSLKQGSCSLVPQNPWETLITNLCIGILKQKSFIWIFFRSIPDDAVTSSGFSSKTKSTNESPTSTSSEFFSTPKSNGTSSEDEVFEDAKDIVTQPEPSSPVHPALRKSGESKATVVLTKVQYLGFINDFGLPYVLRYVLCCLKCVGLSL